MSNQPQQQSRSQQPTAPPSSANQQHLAQSMSGGLPQAERRDQFFKSVGEYNITRLIGSGKFGEVRLAQDINTKEHIAVKIILRSKLKSKKDVDHINREITFMKMLRHPHVVALKEALQTPNNVYLFMELVQGGDLIDRLQKEGRLSERTARKFFQQLVVAVRYCHTQRIAHRDLKLDNMLLDKDDNIKVADFGLANLAADDGSDLMTTVVGSPHYVAPEVLKHADNTATDKQMATSTTSVKTEAAAANGSPTAAASSSSPSTPPLDKSGYDGFKADMWSLGVILYTMLSGHYPFENQNRKKLFEQIVKGEFRMSRSFNAQSAHLISKLLAVDPKERYTINDVLTDEWFKVGFDAKLLLLDQHTGPAPRVVTRAPDGGTNKSPQASATNDALSPLQMPLRLPKAPTVQAPYTNTYEGSNSPEGKFLPANGAAADANAAPPGSPLVRTQQQQQQQQPTVSPALTPNPPALPTNANHPSNNNNNNNNNNGQSRPVRGFYFLGAPDSCSAAMCDVLRRMGCLFQNPEVVFKPGETSQDAQGADRTLYGYCNPRQGSTLQVFTVYMNGENKQSGGAGASSPPASVQRVCSVTVEHRIGSNTEFETFVDQVYAQLGAKVVKAL